VISKVPLRVALVGLLTLTTSSPVFAQYGCGRFIEEADDALVADVDGRYDELAGNLEARWETVGRLLYPYFDFEFAGELILSEDWYDATAEQQQRFAGAFYRFLLYSFGHLVTEYEGDTLRLVGVCERVYRHWGYLFGQSAELKLTGKRPDTIDIDIVMHEVDDEFRIYDIQHEGTSQIKYYRGQFAERLSVEGIDALIDWLEEEAVRQRELQHGRAVSDAGGDPPDD